MSRAFREFYKKKFRASKSPSELVETLTNLKCSQPPGEIFEIIKVVIDDFSNGRLAYPWLGKKSPRDLAWAMPVKVPSLEVELKFASAWINSFSTEINEFLKTKLIIQNQVLDGDYLAALGALTSLKSKFGWSMWGLELEVAISALIHDKERYKTFFSEISSSSKNRLCGLIFQILKDRNDEDISLESFLSKCNNSFPKLAIPDNIKKYLVYRSYGVINDGVKDLASILSIDFLNSVFDYYETLVDGLGLISFTDDKPYPVEALGEAISAIVNSGIVDHRLHKLHFIVLGKYLPFSSQHDFSRCKKIKDLIVKKEILPQASNNGLIVKIEEKIIKLNNYETKNLMVASELFKLGLNIRGTDIGPVLADFSETSFSNLSSESIFPVWIQYIHPDLGVEEFLGGTIDLALSGLTHFNDNSINAEISEASSNLLASLQGNELRLSNEGYPFFWLLKELINSQQLEKAGQLIERAGSFSSKWSLDTSKAKIAYLIQLKNYEESIDLSLNLILNTNTNPREIPIDKLFYRKKWKDFQNINYFKLALIAHFASEHQENTDAKYFCRVSCRTLISIGEISKINALLETSNLEQRLHLVRFLRDVWVEDNLTHAGFFTTQEIRQERIRVLQILLQFDSVREVEYANEIKTLTFDELMWKGIRQVNETRIFVNESAITRWAEKELHDDFNRWKKIVQFDTDPENIVDDLLRQYLSGVEAVDLKYSFEGSKNTEADIIIYGIANRLLERFLSDPADGLDSYLSSRIRHGTLKGTILGPIEEAGLIGASDILLMNGSGILPPGLPADVIARSVSLIKSFETAIEITIKTLIADVIRINSVDAPKGKIIAQLHPVKSGIYLSSLMRECTFQQFTQTSFDVFWKVLQPSLEALAVYFKNDVKNIFQNEFDKLLDHFRLIDAELSSSIDRITKISTQTQAQIDVVSSWFQSDRKIEQQIFRLSEASDVAVSVTKNVYRFFSSCTVEREIENDISLTSLGLLAVTDCLYILLENAWKHSGLGADLSNIYIESFLDNDILVFLVSNPLSMDRAKIVDQKFVDEMCAQFESDEFSDLAAREDGSGFAKLTKLAKGISNRSNIPLPEVSVKNGHWIAKVSIPVYQRGDAYDAYFE